MPIIIAFKMMRCYTCKVKTVIPTKTVTHYMKYVK